MSNQLKNRDLDYRKRIIFSFIGILIPIIFLAMTELVLQLFQYGDDYSLVIESPADNTMYKMNPKASFRYFANENSATIGLQESFKKVKAPNTIRIFVLGESTTIGFPYGQIGSFHTWLKYRLMRSYPDKEFEIINFGLTAVNSYTALGFALELPKYKPDAVLVYLGHNEYVGTLGVGSTSNYSSNTTVIRLMIFLKKFKTTQLLAKAINSLSIAPHSNKKTKKEVGRMELMVKNQSIIYNSKEFNAGVKQFKTNLEAICNSLTNHKIPVFLSTLVSNECNLEPLGQKSENLQAHMFYNQALQCSRAKESKQLFLKAIDYDVLRFRAPSIFNTIIRDITKTNKNIHLADSYRLFEQNSKDSILGNDLILEHVHPNLRGYALISDAFFEALQKATIVDSFSKTIMSFNQLLREMPITAIDSLKGKYFIEYLLSDWPFKKDMPKYIFETMSFEEKMGYALAYKSSPYSDLMDTIINHYEITKNSIVSAKLLEAAILMPPFTPKVPLNAANYYYNLQNYSLAGFYLQKALKINPSEDVAIKGLNLYLSMDEPENCLPFINYLDTKNSDYSKTRAVIQSLVLLKNEYLNDTTNMRTKTDICTLYQKINQENLAKKYNTTN